MTQVLPDFSEKQDFGPLPELVYDARIAKADTFKAKDTGTAMLEVEFELFGPVAEANSAAKRHVIRNFPLAGKGTGFLATLLKAVDIPEPAFRDTNQLVGKVVKVATHNETYEGEPRVKIKNVMKP